MKLHLRKKFSVFFWVGFIIGIVGLILSANTGNKNVLIVFLPFAIIFIVVDVVKYYGKK